MSARARRRAAFALFTSALACTFSPDLSRYDPCGAGRTCPTGYQCWSAENRCLPACDDPPLCGAPLPDASLSLGPAVLPIATEQQPYRADLSADGGVAPYSFRALTPLPIGLQLSDAGVLSGVPEDAGTYPVSLQVDDHSTPPLGATVNRPLAVRALLRLAGPAVLANAVLGQAYQDALSATGGSGGYRFALADGGMLPNGVVLATNGAISGTSSDAGTTSFDVVVTDGDQPAQSAVRRISLTTEVLPIALEISTRSLPDARLGTPYSYQLQRLAGTGPSTWSLKAGTLPDNIGIDTGTGLLSGVPTSRGRSTFTIQLADSLGSVSATFGIDVL